MVEPMRTHPLAPFTVAARAVPGPEPVTLQAHPFRGKLILRAGADVAVRAADSLGFALPPTLRAARGDGIAALWLGPDEWLLLADADGSEPLASRLRAALAEHHHAVVDVSDRLAGIAVRGGRAADVLAAGCALDLHVRAFPAGMVTRTLLGKAQLVLHRPEDAAGFDLYVNASLAPYVWLFLENAAREFGFAVAG